MRGAGFRFIDELPGRRGGSGTTSRLYDEIMMDEVVKYFIIENVFTQKFAQAVVARHACRGGGSGDDDGDGGARRCHRLWVEHRVWARVEQR